GAAQGRAGGGRWGRQRLWCNGNGSGGARPGAALYWDEWRRAGAGHRAACGPLVSCAAHPYVLSRGTPTLVPHGRHAGGRALAALGARRARWRAADLRRADGGGGRNSTWGRGAALSTLSAGRARATSRPRGARRLAWSDGGAPARTPAAGCAGGR